MIERVKVKNYKSIADVDVELGKLNVLVGRNGAGKSTFVDVLRFVRDGLKIGLEMAISDRNGITSLNRWTPLDVQQDTDIELWTQDGEHHAQISFTIGTDSPDSYKVKHEYARADYTGLKSAVSGNPVFGNATDILEVQNGRLVSDASSIEISIEPGLAGIEKQSAASLQLAVQNGNKPGLAKLKFDLIRTSFYTIFPNTLRAPQRPHSESILLDNGQNLGMALKLLIAQNKWFVDLRTAMRKLVGDVIDIRVNAIGGYLVSELRHESGHVIPVDREKWFDFSQESDGTLRMLGLLVALYQDPAPTLIAIEEPELTIHPGALGFLADILREASERTQILITTQSPDLISYFTADELRVVERIDGNTEIGMIDETQREVINSHLFTGGQLLRIEGLHRETAVSNGALNA